MHFSLSPTIALAVKAIIGNFLNFSILRIDKVVILPRNTGHQLYAANSNSSGV